MKVTVDFEECLKDSPRFRATIEDVEGDVGELESKLDRMVKLCIGMIDAGRAYSQANKQFVNGIRELALQSMTDDVIGVAHVHRILFDQAQRSIKSQLQVFVKEDLRKFKEAKKQFDKVSEEKELAQVKNAQAPRNKQHEVEEATNLLTTTRKCFRHIALDYVLQINVLQSKKRLEILKSMLSFMNANMSFFQQGYSLFSELQPLMKQLGGQLDQLVVDSAKEKRDMEQQHSAIQQQVCVVMTTDRPSCCFLSRLLTLSFCPSLHLCFSSPLDDLQPHRLLSRYELLPLFFSTDALCCTFMSLGRGIYEQQRCTLNPASSPLPRISPLKTQSWTTTWTRRMA
uniref:Arf-GAP with coiled-coil, ANK repeat and PH domain-containing protein n=1 Tax=Electrophorus electricus TaxID=8005 RepID=A0A4W4E0Q6_ELEEL